MKIYEVAPDFTGNEASTLMTILQYLVSKTKPGTKIPMANISRLMNNAGFNFSYQNLEELMKVNPGLANMIGDFNADSVTIGDDSVADDESYDSPSTKDKDAAIVDKMAASAAKAGSKL